MLGPSLRSIYYLSNSFLNSINLCSLDPICGLVVRVPGYTTEMYCVSCEVRTEFIYVMQNKVEKINTTAQSRD
jgi:hypothetical protein